MASQDERANAEVVYGSDKCYEHSVELLEELGFPKGVLPLKNMHECGIVRETGFVWMKLENPIEHFFAGTNTLVKYAREVTCYVEKFRMKKISGIKSRQMMIWVPLVEMSIENPIHGEIRFKTPLGIGKSFPASAFLLEEEKEQKVATLIA